MTFDGRAILFHTPSLLNPVTLMAFALSQRARNRIVALLELRDEDDVLAAHCRMNRVPTIRHVVGTADQVVDELTLRKSVIAQQHAEYNPAVGARLPGGDRAKAA